MQGVWANANTLEASREQLQSALEDWILVGIWLGHIIPPIDGIDINRLATPLEPISEAT